MNASSVENAEPTASRRHPGLAWLADRRMVLAVGLLAAVPVIVSTVNAVREGWVPTFDDAIVATNAFDTFSSHSHLVGVYSDASLRSVGPIFNAGPLLFWVLALPAYFLDPWALAVTAGLLNVASIVGIVALARRRGGTVFMYATAVAVLLLLRSFPGETFHSILNTSIALMPFLLLLFLAWSVAMGEYRLLPIAALVASFVLQSHASLAVPAVPVVLLALGGMALSRSRSIRRPGAASDGARHWALGALLVIAVCWIAPVINELTGHPPNLSRLVETATTGQKALGLKVGWHSLVHATGVVPWWMSKSQTGSARFFGVFVPPGALATVSCLLLFGGLATAAGLGWRRKRQDVTVAAVFTLALSLGVVVGVASTPARLALFAEKATRPAQVAGMFVWLATAWAAATLASTVGRPLLSRLGQGRKRLSSTLTLMATAVTALLAVLVASAQDRDTNRSIYRPIQTVSKHLSAVPHHGSVLVTSAEKASVLRAYAISTALVYQLRRLGYHPVLLENFDLVVKFGPYYSMELHRPEHQLVIDDRLVPTQPNARVLARAEPTPPPSPDFPSRPITVSVLAPRVCPLPAPPAGAAADSVSGLHVVHTGIRSSVDRSAALGEHVELCGWAGSTKLHRAADVIAVYSRRRLVAAVKPTIPRPDVLRSIPVLRSNATGFSIDVPRRLLAGGSTRDIEVYALAAGEAAPIPLHCQIGLRDLGC